MPLVSVAVGNCSQRSPRPHFQPQLDSGRWKLGFALPRGTLKVKGMRKPQFLLSTWGRWHERDLAGSFSPGTGLFLGREQASEAAGRQWVSFQAVKADWAVREYVGAGTC